MNTINEKKCLMRSRAVEAIGQVRSVILDAVELESGQSSNWKLLRSRLLKALGKNGLEGRIIKEIDAIFGQNGGATWDI